MLTNPVTWTVLAPLLGGVVAALFLLVQNGEKTPSRYVPWLRLIAFLAVMAGLVAEVVLLLEGSGSVTYYQLGITLAMTTPARFVLVAANVSLFCAAIMAWMSEDETHSPDHEWGVLSAALTSSLLAGAGLASDRIVSALCLFGAALAVSALALARPRAPIPQVHGDSENLRARTLLARRIAGGLKHLGLATLGTGLLVVGAVLVARYMFNLENKGLLQLGLALLATGIVVRAAGMPFAAASADSIQAAPSASLLMLGASVPVVLVAGLLMLAPVEGTLAGGAAAGWLGAIAALLAGLRALGTEVPSTERQAPSNGQAASTRYSLLVAMTVASAVSWAIFGVLSGSQTGAVGAVLIATNIALALPIIVMGRYWTAAGVASLLGLPPFGGFAGTILVAGSAANSGGIWLVILLAGSALVAAGWLRIADWPMDYPGRERSKPSPGWRDWLTNPAYLLPTLLIIVQVALFLASSQLIAQLNDWAKVPWLVGP
jgi:formate hydrogenlyase subunit 3/multisubunit Na+/H+ antiporter MnhD subunit